MSEFRIRKDPFTESSDQGRNKMVRDEGTYIPEVQPTRKWKGGERSPNYSQLFKTPSRSTIEKLTTNTRFGTPVNDSFWKKSTVIPMRKAETKKIGEVEEINMVTTVTTPLEHNDNRVKKLPNETATEGKTPIRELENRFDTPYTKREMEQLRLKQLKNNQEIKLHLDRIAKLSREVRKDLKEYLGGDGEEEKVLASTMKPSASEDTSEEVPSLSPAPYLLKQEQTKRLIESAIKDLTELDTEQYDQLSTEEQKEVLRRLRTKYKTPKKYNQKQLRKAVDDYIEELEEEITELEI